MYVRADRKQTDVVDSSVMADIFFPDVAPPSAKFSAKMSSVRSFSVWPHSQGRLRCTARANLTPGCIARGGASASLSLFDVFNYIGYAGFPSFISIFHTLNLIFH